MDNMKMHLVERFYSELWNQQDFGVANEILAPDFRFRGSLGTETTGITAFITYAQSVHAALADYCCNIDEFICDDTRVAARMTFAGVHSGHLFGVAASGRHISWAGAAFFEIAPGRLTALWVLGDVDELKRQLGARSASPF